MTLIALAERLTDKQREALLQADGGYLRSKHMLGNIVRALVAEGLLPPRPYGAEQDNRLTRKGIEVRNYLRATTQGATT